MISRIYESKLKFLIYVICGTSVLWIHQVGHSMAGALIFLFGVSTLLSVINYFAGERLAHRSSLIGSVFCGIALIFSIVYFISSGTTNANSQALVQTIDPKYQATFVDPSVADTSLTGTLSFKNPLAQTKTYHIELAIKDSKTNQITLADVTANVGGNTSYTNTLVIILPDQFKNQPVQVKLAKVVPID